MIDATWTWIGGVNNGLSVGPSMGGSSLRKAAFALIFCSRQEGGLLGTNALSCSTFESIPWALEKTRSGETSKALFCSLQKYFWFCLTFSGGCHHRRSIEIGSLNSLMKQVPLEGTYQDSRWGIWPIPHSIIHYEPKLDWVASCFSIYSSSHYIKCLQSDIGLKVEQESTVIKIFLLISTND